MSKYDFPTAPASPVLTGTTSTTLNTATGGLLAFTKNSQREYKTRWRVQNETGGPVYFCIDGAACTIATSHGSLEDGQVEYFDCRMSRLAIYNASGATLNYNHASSNFWCVAWP